MVVLVPCRPKFGPSCTTALKTSYDLHYRSQLPLLSFPSQNSSHAQFGTRDLGPFGALALEGTAEGTGTVVAVAAVAAGIRPSHSAQPRGWGSTSSAPQGRGSQKR